MNNASFLRKANPYAKKYTEEEILAMFEEKEEKEDDKKGDHYSFSKQQYWERIAEISGELFNALNLSVSRSKDVRDWLKSKSDEAGISPTKIIDIFIKKTKVEDEKESKENKEPEVKDEE